jgi:hypothetical protein
LRQPAHTTRYQYLICECLHCVPYGNHTSTLTSTLTSRLDSLSGGLTARLTPTLVTHWSWQLTAVLCVAFPQVVGDRYENMETTSYHYGKAKAAA